MTEKIVNFGDRSRGGCEVPPAKRAAMLEILMEVAAKAECGEVTELAIGYGVIEEGKPGWAGVFVGPTDSELLLLAIDGMRKRVEAYIRKRIEGEMN